MCWSSFSKPELKVAEDNIPVTKVLHVGPFKNMISLNYNFIYELNKIYKIDGLTTEPLDDYGKEIIINKGFHSYVNPIDVNSRNCRDGWIAIYLLKGNIIDSFQSSFPINRELNSCIYKAAIADCIIPKGSTYYLNSNGEYVSNSIKIINVYKIK